MRLILLLISIVCTADLRAQSLRYRLSSPYHALNAYSNHHQDAFAFASNQAALAKATSMSIGAGAEQRFMLADNRLYILSAAIPAKSLGNIGVNASYSGNKNFNESQVGLAYARSLGTKADVGLQFNYYGYRIPGYSSASAVTGEIGIILHLLPQLNTGLHVYNPVKVPLGKNGDEALATIYTFGIGYDVSENVFIGSTIIKEEGRNVGVNAGVQYQFMKRFFARAGIVSGTKSFYAGAGVLWNDLRLDVSTGYHQQLGFSAGISAIYSVSKR